jgi:hypothetical protein
MLLIVVIIPTRVPDFSGSLDPKYALAAGN